MNIAWQSRRSGFALPSVIIASLVMFTVLVATVGSVASVRTALDQQYYEALARDAADSGANFVKSCIADPAFVTATPLNPTKNCTGGATGASMYLMNTSLVRTTYSATLTYKGSDGKKATVTGTTQLLRSTNGAVWKTYTATRGVHATLKIDPNGDRASQRYWYFGRYAGLDFGTSGVKPIASLPSAAPVTPAAAAASNGAAEGTTVTSSKTGELLFWSDGLRIWNKVGDFMLDSTGNGTPLLGAQSSAQASVSFPLNFARTQFGVVSNTGSNESGTGELYYHRVDMTLDNGKGAIVAKNQALSGDTDYTSEALNAMPNSDGTGYYVYTYKVDTTSSVLSWYLVKTDGTIQGRYTQTIPSTLVNQCDNPGPGQQYGYGSVNFNSDYTLMAVGVGARYCPDANSGRVYIYRTDRLTGTPSLVASWTTVADTTSEWHGLYEADFSPSGRYMYVSNIYPSSLLRYDISSLDSATIKASEWMIAAPVTSVTNSNEPISSGGHIRRGPDGRMYIADVIYETQLADNSSRPGPHKISYIDNPDADTNTAAAIGLNLDGITLPYNSVTSRYTTSQWGLPQTATVYEPEILIY